MVSAIRPGDYQIPQMAEYKAYMADLERVGFYPPLARRDIPPVPFTLPFDWHADPLSDRNWMFQLQSWRMLDAYLNALHNHDISGRELDHVLAIIRDWYRDNVVEGEGAWSWYDMATGIRASKLAFISHAMEEMGGRFEEIDIVDDLVSCHFEKLMDRKRLSSGDHGLFQLWGLKQLASAFPGHKHSGPAAEYAIEAMIQLVKRQLGERGVHTEHSVEYHFFTHSRISSILDSPEWRIPEMVAIRQRLDEADSAKPWLVDVQGRLVPAGDSGNGRLKLSGLAALQEWPHERWGDVVGAVLDGYVVVRTAPNVAINNSSFVFCTATFNSRTHKHADCLSFIWQEKGEDILVDSGKYGYQNDRFREYFTSTRAHNTVEVNQSTSVCAKKDAYGSGVQMLAGGADGWKIECVAPHPTDGYTHNRVLIVRPGHELVVFDKVSPSRAKSKQNNEYTLWWHFPKQLTAKVEKNRVYVSGFAALPGVTVRHFSNASGVRVSQHYGEKEGGYQGWISTGYLKAEPAPAVGCTGYTSGDFIAVTVLRIGNGEKLSGDALMTDIARLDWDKSTVSMLEHLVEENT